MKVTNLVLRPDKMIKFEKVELNLDNGARTYQNLSSSEAIIALDRDDINPESRFFNTWDELVRCPDPTNLKPRKVSKFACLTGDNPFLLVSSAGIPLPQQRVKGPRSYIEVKDWVDRVFQSALQSQGVRRASKDPQQGIAYVMMGVAAVLGIAALCVALIVLPEVISRF
jgi:hypothetical protein